jgi:hypothetical protein
MPNKRSRLLLTVLGGGSDPAASFTVTTTGAQTLTIGALTVSADTTVEWGDGSTDTYSGAGARTHNYAGAGAWRIRILQPLNVTAFNMEAPGVLYSFNSANIGKMSNTTDFRLSFANARTTVFNLADFAAWRPIIFITYNGEVNVTGTFNSASISGWAPLVVFYHLNNANVVCTFARDDFNGLVATNEVSIGNNGLSQAQVNAVLLGLYTAAQSRTATGGSIDISGTNAAPSGVYAAECPPTTGKSAAFELINDSCGTIAAGETWTTITVTGGLP